MKIWVQTETDFDNEVIDISIVIEEGDTVKYCWVCGFDENDWQQADVYAELLSKTLGCEVVET
jgi:hypothetical protein